MNCSKDMNSEDGSGAGTTVNVAFPERVVMSKLPPVVLKEFRLQPATGFEIGPRAVTRPTNDGEELGTGWGC